MTCANWGITILSAVVLLFAIFPAWLGVASQWITAIAAVFIMVVVWTGCNCKWCEMAEKASKSKKK